MSNNPNDCNLPPNSEIDSPPACGAERAGNALWQCAYDGVNAPANRPVEKIQAQDPGLVRGSKDFDPSLEECHTASRTLENGLGKLIRESDLETMTSMIDALTVGDEKAFGKAVKKVGDKEMLKSMSKEINMVLHGKGCSARLDVGDDNNKVMVSDECSGIAITFDTKSGEAQAWPVSHLNNGRAHIVSGEPLYALAHPAFMRLAAGVVFGTNSANIDATDAWAKNPSYMDNRPWPLSSLHNPHVLNFQPVQNR